MDYTKPNVCDKNKKPEDPCPDGTELVCYEGEWSCSGSCDYVPEGKCQTGYDYVCSNGTWECVMQSCDNTPGAVPVCPPYTNLVCAEGTWLCDGCDPSTYDKTKDCKAQTCVDGQWKCYNNID